MRLTSFRVKTFRNIVDSGDVLVDKSVICLVGKNEAGKSALLQALHHLKPANHAPKLDLLDEYPRWLNKEHEISGEIKTATPITAEFALDAEELDQMETRFGAGTLKSKDVVFSRAYANPDEIQVTVDIDFSKFLTPFIKNLPEELRTALGAIPTSDVLNEALVRIVGERATDGEASTILADQASEAQQSLKTPYGESNNLTQAIGDALRVLLPSTFYFSQYAQLEGRYNIRELFPAIQAGSSDESIQAAADFLKLARVVPASIAEWDFEKSNAELEATSSLLTRRVQEHWHQNENLKLRAFLEVVPQPPNEVERFLQFRVEDTRHDFSSRLDRRSTGFRWFVSFIASFLEFEQSKDIILLLDEPGLTLHARAQMDLLDTIENQLAKDRQVLYTTHSPFMVRISKLDGARIVEDQGPTVGSVVTNDAGAVTDPDTLFPLQAALGYDIAQNLFIGNQNVILEGISDFIYLSAISGHLESSGRNHLSESTRLLPAGGASNIPTFIALIGSRLDVVVVLDGNSDAQRIENAIAKARFDQAKILQVDSFCKVSKADIEDLFEPSEYLDLYNATFGPSVSLSDLKGKDRIVKRIARHMGAEFNHGLVGAHFLRNLDSSISSLSTDTIDRFEKLIEAINAALPTK
jgi:predicted ATP-dependent endonuclease of OLD family